MRNKTRFKIMLLLLFLFGAPAWATNHYVRESATGASNGSDWTNAFVDLPAALVRSDVYYVADGNYCPKGYSFDDAVDGERYITVLKATAASHGTDVGWNSNFGDGAAVFAPLQFRTGYWIFDGVSGGGPAGWTTGHGFRITTEGTGYDIFITIGHSGVYASNIRIIHADIGMATQSNPGCDCAVYSVNGADNVTFAYCYIHHFGDVGLTMIGGDGWLFEYNRMDRLDRYGLKDGICGPLGQINHGTGLELYSMTNLTIRYNSISNIGGTGWIGNYGDIGENLQNVFIYGNFFYNTPDYSEAWGNGIIYTNSNSGAYENLKVYNNTFTHLNHHTILGINYEIGVNEFKNNIVYDVAGTPYYGGCIRDHNASDQPIPGDANLQVLSSNPFVDGFNLKTPTDPGIILPSPFNMDMFGHTRGADGVWDRGAVEFVAEIQQSIPLALGWNWISFNVLPASRSLDSIFTSILSQIEQMKGQTQSAIRVANNWKGDLADMSGIGSYKMYKVKVSTACILTVTGMAIAQTTSIPLQSGWNWVAYLPTTALPIATALASINGQVLEVKSLTQSATYSGSVWSGTLTQLEPGQGYAIKMSTPGILTYPAAAVAATQANQQKRNQ